MKRGVDFIGTTVVFACHDGEGNYLLAQRGNAARDEWGTWDPGGESMEFGEDPVETLHRGIMEEYATRVIAAEFLGFRNVLRTSGGVPTHWLALDYRVHIDRSLAKNGEPHKLAAIAWHRLDALPSPLSSPFPHFLEKYKNSLK